MNPHDSVPSTVCSGPSNMLRSSATMHDAEVMCGDRYYAQYRAKTQCFLRTITRGQMTQVLAQRSCSALLCSLYGVPHVFCPPCPFTINLMDAFITYYNEI